MKTDSVKTKAQSIEKQSSEFETRIAFPLRIDRSISAYGSLSKYADPSKRPLEDSAWADAVAEKNALDNKNAE